MTINATAMTGLSGAEFFDLSSDEIGETYRIYIGSPVPLEEDKTYPVIYVLDGNLNFPLVYGAHRLMLMTGEVQPAYIVGIGYADETVPFASLPRRYRDLSPTPGGEFERVMQKSQGIVASEPGGGPAFLKFLKEDIIPAVEQNYKVDAGRRCLSGASLAGLFTVWVLLHEPHLFRNYIAISPALWWDNQSFYSWAGALDGVDKDVVAKVFITAGAEETAAAAESNIDDLLLNAPEEFKAQLAPIKDAFVKYGAPKMAEFTSELHELLQSSRHDDIQSTWYNFPEETHMSVPGPAYSRGLRFMFDSWTP